MERDSYQDKLATLGTILDSNDIRQMTRTLFKPAIKQCEADKSAPGVIVYSKESLDDTSENLAIDHYYSFHAMKDTNTKVITFGISEEVTENITLDQLDDDECNQIRLQFQQQHVATGHQVTELTTNPTWNALYAPEIFNHVTLSLSLTTSYVFKGDQAQKTFSAERRLRVNVGGDGEDLPSHYDTVLNAFHFDDKALSVDEQVKKEEGWEPEHYAELDTAGETILTMTTKDQEHVMTILRHLELVPTHNPRGLFQED